MCKGFLEGGGLRYFKFYLGIMIWQDPHQSLLVGYAMARSKSVPARVPPTCLTRKEKDYALSWTVVSAGDSPSSLTNCSFDNHVRKAKVTKVLQDRMMTR